MQNLSAIDIYNLRLANGSTVRDRTPATHEQYLVIRNNLPAQDVWVLLHTMNVSAQEIFRIAQLVAADNRRRENDIRNRINRIQSSSRTSRSRYGRSKTRSKKRSKTRKRRISSKRRSKKFRVFF